MPQMDYMKILCLLLLLVVRTFAMAQDAPRADCPQPVSEGDDFWVSFMWQPQEYRFGIFPKSKIMTIVAAGENDADVTVENPNTNWSSTQHLVAGSSVTFTVPTDMAISTASCTPRNAGFHVSSTAPISLFSSNYQEASHDIATILPTSTLRGRYIVQDYPGFKGAMIMMLATEDSTVLTMQPPCPSSGGSYAVGQTLSVTLQAGQTYQMWASGSNSFSGMEIVSNGKPFALFQGSTEAQVPQGYAYADHIYDQAMPVETWGLDYVLVPTAVRTGGDRVRVTAAGNGCVLTLDGTVIATLQKGQTHEFHLPSGPAKRLLCSQPASVGLYVSGRNYGGTPGDPAMVMLPPVEQGVCHSSFYAINTVLTHHHYANIVTRTENVAGMMLDSVDISSQFTPMDTLYSYAKVPLAQGVHSIDNTQGTFIAHFYGLGADESYAYVAGMSARKLTRQLLVDGQDSTHHHHAIQVCEGDSLNFEIQPIFNDGIVQWYLADSLLQADSTSTFSCRFDTAMQTTLLAIAGYDTIYATVTIHPTYHYHDTLALCQHTPLTYCDSILPTAQPGTEVFDIMLSSQNGCDSLRTLQLTVRPLSRPVHTLDTVIDPGTSATLLAWGTDHCTWTTLSDSVITTQFTCTVTPIATTTYRLIAIDSLTTPVSCPVVDSITVFVGSHHDTAICSNQLPFLWDGITFPAAMTKRVTIGTDSTELRRLIVNPVYDLHDTLALCQHTPLTYCDSTIPTEVGDGVQRSYSFHLATHNGCDSLRTLHLVVNPVYRHHDTLALCQHTPLVYHDSTISTQLASLIPITTDLHFTTQEGCDSTYTLNLTVNPVYDLHDTLALCQHTTLTYCDSTIPTNVGDGIQKLYSFHLATSSGCDSLRTLHLSVNPVYDLHDTIALCQHTPFTYCDSIMPTQHADSIYRPYSFHLATHTGCDSLRTLHLAVNPVYHHNDTIALCQHTPLVYHDSTISTQLASILSHTTDLHFTTQEGCDSTYTLNLTVNPVFDLHDTLALCQHTLLTYCDSTMPTNVGDGIQKPYSFHLNTRNGCDSLRTLHLSVNPVYDLHDTIAICQYTPFTYCDSTIPTNVADPVLRPYSFHLATHSGCDSLRTLHLAVNPVYHHSDTIQLCQGSQLHYCDTILNPWRTDQHHFPFLTTALCDSTYTLTLNVLPTRLTLLADSFCTGTVYYFHDRPLTYGGSYDDTLTASNGCDSVVSLALTQLSKPMVKIVAEHDCTTRQYRLHAETNVDYIHWSAEPAWNSAWGSPHASSILISPSHDQQLTLLADYFETPTCPNTAQVVLHPILQPVALIDARPQMLTYDSPTLVATSRSTDATYLQWYIDGIDAGTATSITHPADLDHDSVALLLVASNDLCTDTASATIPIRTHHLFAPNVFTPDEATNRRFLIAHHGIIQYELTIYTRQGLLVFHTLDPDQGWDGTHNGTPCPQATYVWVLNYRTNVSPQYQQTAKGTVTLLR